MQIKKLNGRGFASNTYAVISGTDAAVVDPAAEVSEILNAIYGAKLRYILLTHGHFDHILKLDSLKRETGAEICIHRADANMLGDPELNASGFFCMDFAALGADLLLEDGDELALGRDMIKVISSPGHTPGSVCFECSSGLICGDTLFASGYGRYDLPGGDPQLLFSSLAMLAARNDDPIIYPGHGTACKLSASEVISAIRNNNY